MNVAAAPATWLPIQETAAEFRQECGALEQFVEKLLFDLDLLRLQIEHKADELELAQQQLVDRTREFEQQRDLSNNLGEQLQRQETQLKQAITELQQVRQQLEQQSCQRSAQESQTGEGVVEHRPQWLSEMDDYRAQLSEVQSELSSALQRVAEYGTPAQPSAESEGSAEWLQERAGLESELEMVRSRAAELQDTVDAQRQELAEARTEVSNELKLLRRLVEQQSELLERGAGSSVAAAVEAEVSASEAAGDDPVMNSVAAQFARLQKDMAQRRKKK